MDLRFEMEFLFEKKYDLGDIIIDKNIFNFKLLCFLCKRFRYQRHDFIIFLYF